jgi:Uri superfamily endonuclease
LNAESNVISKLSTGGVYTLMLFVSTEVTLTIGKLGKQTFPCGYYTYTGSALGKGATNLKHRIARHLRKTKKLFWHIDFLLANPNVSVKAVIVAETNKRMECTVNSHLKDISGAKIPFNGFGASDCKKNCKSHLLFFPEIKNADCLVQELVEKLESSAGVVCVVVLD